MVRARVLVLDALLLMLDRMPDGFRIFVERVLSSFADIKLILPSTQKMRHLLVHGAWALSGVVCDATTPIKRFVVPSCKRIQIAETPRWSLASNALQSVTIATMHTFTALGHFHLSSSAVC